MELNHNLDDFRRDLQKARDRIPDEVLDPLVTFAQTWFTEFATRRYMRDAGQNAGPRDPNDTGPLRVVSTRLSRGVEGSFYQGRREGKTEFDMIPSGARWRRIISVPYAAVHEEGGEWTQQVTEKQRAFFWAMFYEAESREEKDKWKAMALSSRLRIKIKARPYAGPAMEGVAPKVVDRANELLYELVMDVRRAQ